MRFLVGALLIVVVGCYDVPRPACGFACGPNAECPTGYTCNNDSALADFRCHLDGTPLVVDPELCPPAFDNTPFDPRPRVLSNTLEVETITPTLMQFSLVISSYVTGVDETTFRLIREDGQEVAGNIEDIGGSGTTLIMSFPIFTLVTGHTYTVEVSGNIFDSNGYRLVPYHYSFAVLTDLPPFITRHEPGIDAGGVNVDPDLYFMLNESVVSLDETDFVLRRNGTVVPTQLHPQAVLEDSVWVAATKQLEANTVYTLTVLPEFYDLGGNVFPGESWSFMTGPDNVPASWTSVPYRSEGGVPVDRTIRVTFDENVTPVNATTMQLETLVGNVAIDASVTYDPGDFEVVIDPILQLAPNTSYRVRFAVRDAASNPPASTSLGFATGNDLSGANVRSTTPQAEATGAPRTGPISIVFDESVMAPNPSDFVVRMGGIELIGTVSAVDARTWQFAPAATLPASTAIRVEVLVTDLFGNAAFYSYEFTTGP